MDNQTDFSKILAGAAIGAGIAFLLFTEKGHRFLNQAEPWLGSVIQDLQKFQSAAGRAREAMDEGRRSFAAVSDAIPFVHAKHRDWSSEPHH